MEIDHCQRCNFQFDTDEIVVTKMSWFSEETICKYCIEREEVVLSNFRLLGISLDDLEGKPCPAPYNKLLTGDLRSLSKDDTLGDLAVEIIGNIEFIKMI